MPKDYEEAIKQGWTALSGNCTSEEIATNVAEMIKERMPVLTAVTPASNNGLFHLWCTTQMSQLEF